jgi:hypothetical protein
MEECEMREGDGGEEEKEECEGASSHIVIHGCAPKQILRYAQDDNAN